MRNLFKTFRKAQGGSVTIEFVVTFPLLLAALGMSFEFGQLFLAHHDTVNNVREAARYLSRGDLSAAQLAVADEIVRTGAPAGGTAPDWLAAAQVTITPSYTTFTNTNFRVSGQVVRVRVDVDFPMTIFDFAVDGHTSIPFVVIDDIRHFGD
jgi:Flp pilus assembly protein TadG